MFPVSNRKTILNNQESNLYSSNITHRNDTDNRIPQVTQIMKSVKYNWNEENTKKLIELINDGKNFTEIAKILNTTQAVISRKSNILGYKSNYLAGYNKGETKYITYDWIEIQKAYDSGLSFTDLNKDFSISTVALQWAVKNNYFKSRTNSESLSIAWKTGKFKASSSIGLVRYRQLCEFKFSLKDYPDRFDFKLIEEYGWYKAKNRGDNLGGVSRDHMYSVKDGYINDIDPEIIAHPANCRLIRHYDNSKKKDKSSVTLEELMERITNW